MRRVALLAVLALAACKANAPRPPEPAPRAHDEIVICGKRFATGAPVVLWDEPGGYDAYDTRFLDEEPPPSADRETGRRYTPGRVEREGEQRVLVPPDCTDPARLAEAIDLFVVHYDVCGASSRCFEVLQRKRGLSVHFLLDVDGTIYQTLDLRETAWHASQANPRSVGVEIAQIGAYPPRASETLDAWYGEDERGVYVRLPEALAATVRTPGFVARPARPERIVGAIQGETLAQYDFTPEQYDSLAKLLATLCTALPRIRPDAPRDVEGRVRTDALTDDELARFSGLLGHEHVTARKIDPGPAFDWERVLDAVRARVASP